MSYQGCSDCIHVSYKNIRQKLGYVRRIDDANHAVLTVLHSGTVEPNGSRRIGDCIHEVGVGRLLSVGGVDVTRPEAVVKRFAWRVESCLCYRVAFWPEIEHDDVAFFSSDFRRVEGHSAIFAADRHIDIISEGSASEGSRCADGREMHCRKGVECRE